jgi:HSP20 family protein
MDDQTTLPAEERRPATAMPAPLNRLRDEIDRLFEDFSFARPARPFFPFAGAGTLSPPTELSASDGGYQLSVELPGLEEKDIDIEFADGVLTISGEKREESEKKENGYLLSERRYGTFRRQLTLPTDANPETIEAKFKQGVLKLEMKKDEKARDRTRKITIG